MRAARRRPPSQHVGWQKRGVAFAKHQVADADVGGLADALALACHVESWTPLSVYDSLGILLSVFPGGHKRAVDCVLAAHNCQEVEACSAFYLADADRREEEVLLLPECGSERTDHCEGNVAKYCENDNDGTLYQASYDCTLAGATCIVTEAAGERYADCQAPQLQQCAGDETEYCDGTRAVICKETTTGSPSPWIHDCADAFDSHCVVTGDIECEGPVVGEKDCNDGIDGDSDGKVDCADDDCACVENCSNGIDDDGDGKVDCDDADDCHFCQ